jgi:hypothetical protein
MSVETRKVLEMLADKKITAEEADKLLEKLCAPGAAGESKTETSASTPSAPSSSSSSKPRFLRISIDKPGKDQVNVRIPLAFARSGSRLLAVLPTRVREKLTEQGIDVAALGGMDAKEWGDLVETVNVDIEKGDGKKVRVFCE